MNLINKTSILFFIIPFVLIFAYGYFMDYLPKRNPFKVFMDIIVEKDLKELLEKNGIRKTSLQTYQLIRIISTILIFLFVIVFLGGFSAKNLLVSVIAIFAIYKFFYIFMLYVDKTRISRLNNELPYLMKSLIYLMYSYNVETAIRKCTENVNTIYKYDLEILLEDIKEDPITKTPYETFINRYNGKIKNLDMYLTTLYRIARSGSTTEATKLMSNINETISVEVANARASKNKTTNFIVGWLGMIPVLLSVLIVCYMMVLTITAI